MRPTTTGDGSMTLHSERYGQAFHSLHGAVTETEHVFLESSGVAGRLRNGQHTSVLEVGFGTGLNCLLTADAAMEHGASLELLSLEQNLVPAELLNGLGFQAHLRHPELLSRYLEFRENLPGELPAGSLHMNLAENVLLELRLGQAEDQVLPAAWADAVYHDAFSPEVNHELWTPAFLAKLERSLKSGGALVTYSVKSEVRRRLQELGLNVARLAGPPGGKRQMLLASKT